MTFLSYRLPKGAPQKLVWFAQCDKCLDSFKGPFGNSGRQQKQMKEDITQAGWRYQFEHPMDTCPACLAIEVATDE